MGLEREVRARVGVSGGEAVAEGLEGEAALVVVIVAADARVLRLRGEGSGVGVGAGDSWKSLGWLRVATIVAVDLL